MPRIVKYDDTNYENVPIYTKIFMYINQDWDNLSPYVEILRLLNRSMVTYKYGKNQNNIRSYGTHYNHTVFGCEFKNKEDYFTNIVKGVVKFVFIFTDNQDTFSTNMIQFVEKHKVNFICFSNIDSMYHFHDFSTGEITRVTIKNPNEIINKMKELIEINSFQKIAEMFPEFDIIPENPEDCSKTLEKCLDKMRKCNLEEKKSKESKRVKNVDINKVYFDPHMSKIKKKEYEREQKTVKYDDDPVQNKSSIRQFFNKK